jgi:flagellar biogenesis protein FliO
MEEIRQTGAGMAVIGLLTITLWWFRRRGAVLIALRRGSRKRLENLERLSLGPQHALHLVRLGKTALLVSTSPAGCALIDRPEWREIDPVRDRDS